MLPRIFSKVALVFLLLGPAVAAAQQNPSALASEAAFRAAIHNHFWECSASTYQRVRFVEDRLETVNDSGVVINTLRDGKCPAPGIMQFEFSNGTQGWFIFSDDLQTFVMSYTGSSNEFAVPEGAALPPFGKEGEPANGMLCMMIGHQDWKEVKFFRDKMELRGPDGVPYATNEAAVCLPHVLAVTLPAKKTGCAVFPRQGGKGTWLPGWSLYFGVRQNLSGPFRPRYAVALSAGPGRSAQFIQALGKAQRWQEAHAAAIVALSEAREVHGETSTQVTAAMDIMATSYADLRRWVEAETWHSKALEHSLANHGANDAQVVGDATSFARMLLKQGKFEQARGVLDRVRERAPKLAGNVKELYWFHQLSGEAAFGMRDNAAATAEMQKAAKAVEGQNVDLTVIETLGYLTYCYLAQNNNAEAAKACAEYSKMVDKGKAEHPNQFFDTTQAALVWSSLGRWDDALRYLPDYPPGSRQNPGIAVADVVRILVLWNSNKRKEARELAEKLVPRFSARGVPVNEGVAVFMKLVEAIADPTTAKLTAAEQEWNTQVEEMKKRPLHNYAMARLVRFTLSSLPGARR
jgi:tetratricopeptide (TPR) repeat protein